jgi:hypothetical protein
VNAPTTDITDAARVGARLTERLAGQVDADRLGEWARTHRDSAQVARAQFAGLEAQLQVLRQSKADRELEAELAETPWSLPDLSLGIEHLRAYLAGAGGLLAGWRLLARRRAAAVLGGLRLPLSAANAQRALAFLELVRARQLVGDLVSRLPCAPACEPSTRRLLKIAEEHRVILSALDELESA